MEQVAVLVATKKGYETIVRGGPSRFELSSLENKKRKSNRSWGGIAYSYDK